MNTEILEKIQADQLKKRKDVRVGDTVRLHIRISEGDKSRIQIFEGIVLSLKGKGMDSTITVRKISSGVGVERILPLHSPTLEKIEVVKRGSVRRSKLYYMRKRVGRKAMKIRGTYEFIDRDDDLDESEDATDEGSKKVVEEEVAQAEEATEEKEVAKE